uniref:SsDNA-binding protein n=1 Tax=Siphoviridae sp. ct6GI21 TaxID=2825340 RepID=A0A8S5U4D2_9CAUD|nr:MAG TPA: ssDNA-binding protein [Siphoviridae sp. ct6GI21]
MGRISYDDVDKYGGSDSEFLKLQNDGDMVTAQLMVHDMDDIDIYACHSVAVGKWDDGNDKTRFVNCLRNYDDPLDVCPLCEAGLKTQVVMMLAMVDQQDGKIKIWNRGKTFIPKIKNFVNRWGDMTMKPVDIIRNGKKGDKKTTYDIQISPAEPMDISQYEKPEFLGGYIMDKSADEMQEYLDTGSFPDTDNSDNEDNTQVRRRNTEPLPRRGASRASRATSRRAGM